MRKIIKFLKDWTLIVAMLSGTVGYLAFANIPLMEPLKPITMTLIEILTPTLIFTQLLLTFCKIEPRDLLPKRWNLWLLMIQFSTCMAVGLALIFLPINDAYRGVWEGLMVTLICPTATAAAVITGKLGGNPASLITYTLLCNLLCAVVVPLLFPLVELQEGMTFITAFLKILSKVFPLLLVPFLVAMLLRYCFPTIHKALLKIHNLSFYLWAVALTIVTAQTVRSLVNSPYSIDIIALTALAGLISCLFQFFVGRRIGARYGERISAGQSIGQKNTVLAIWMSYTYLNPISSIAPGSYVVWQNIINTWQLWRQRRA